MNSFEHFRFNAGQVQLRLQSFRVKGADCVEFLHGQTSADVNHLGLNQFNVHALVDRTGKIEAHFYLLKDQSSFVILSSAVNAAAIRTRFEKFVISEDVELVDEGEKDYWIALGPQTPAKAYQGKLGGENAAISSDELSHIAQLDRIVLADFLTWQGEPMPDEAYHVGELINQTRLFDVAVDMKKGCFPGQETVAKVYHNRGAAWAPVLLKATPAEQTVAAEIFIEDKKVAKVFKQDNEGQVRWCTAEVLRDVRVENMSLPASGKQNLLVVSYPRFPSDNLAKAKYLFFEGTEAFQHEKADEALSAWSLAISLAPDYADPYEAMGVLLGRQGKYDEAIEWMKQLLKVDPQSVMAHTNLSLFLMKQGKIQEAEEHKSLATVASFASFGREAQALEVQEAEQKKAEAERQQRERMFREVLEIDPQDALANFGLGSLDLERGQFAQAQQRFEAVIKSDAQYSVAYLGLGKALMKLGNKQHAKEILQAGVKVAAKKGEMMPANEMQSLLSQLL